MDEDSYSTEVQKQIRAYGFEPAEISTDLSTEAIFMEKKDSGQKNVIIVKSLPDDGLDSLQTTVNQVRETLKDKIDVSFSWSGNQFVICHLCLLASSVTGPMEIFVQEGCKITEGDVRVYPVLVDLEGERLVYRDISLSERFYVGTADKKAEKLFQLY